MKFSWATRLETVARAKRIKSARGRKLLKKRLHVRKRKPRTKPKNKSWQKQRRPQMLCCLFQGMFMMSEWWTNPSI